MSHQCSIEKKYQLSRFFSSAQGGLEHSGVASALYCIFTELFRGDGSTAAAILITRATIAPSFRTGLSLVQQVSKFSVANWAPKFRETRPK